MWEYTTRVEVVLRCNYPGSGLDVAYRNVVYMVGKCMSRKSCRQRSRHGVSCREFTDEYTLLVPMRNQWFSYNLETVMRTTPYSYISIVTNCCTYRTCYTHTIARKCALHRFWSKQIFAAIDRLKNALIDSVQVQKAQGQQIAASSCANTQSHWLASTW